MRALALRSLRHRASGFTATVVSVLLAGVLMGSFTPLLQRALAGGIPSTDRQTLIVMGAVVGGIGMLIALFAVTSTVGVTIAQRDVETGLLRTLGATRSQVRRLVRVETLLVTALAAATGSLVGALVGNRALLAGMHRGNLVTASVSYRPGWVAAAATTIALVVAALVAAGVAGHRATRGTPSIVPGEESRGSERIAWWRWLLAVALVGYGITMGIITVTVSRYAPDPYDAMSTAGSDALLVGLGLAVICPALLRGFARIASATSPAAHLASHNLRRRSQLFAGVLGPVIVLTSAVVSTVILVGIDRRTLPPGHGADERAINTLNDVVVGMIALFAAIMVVNSFAAVIVHRRHELQRLRLLGADRHQVHASVVTESVYVGILGVAVGLVASLATIVPFGIARGEGVVPDAGLWLPWAVAAAVLALTTAAARIAVGRATREQALP